MTEEENTLDNRVENTTYELGYLIVSTVPEENIQVESNKVRDMLEGKGSVTSSIDARELQLSYSMDKVISNKKEIFNKAYFGSFIFETTAGNIGKIQDELEKNINILRFLITKRSKESLVPPKARIIPTKEKTDNDKPKKEIKTASLINEKELDKTIEKLIVE